MANVAWSPGGQPDEEPRLARQLVGAFSSLGADRAAALFTHAAWLALRRPVEADSALEAHESTPVRSSLTRTRQRAAWAQPGGAAKPTSSGRQTGPAPLALQDIEGIADTVVDTRVAALQGLIDRAEFKHFDRRMEASMAKSIDAIFNGTQWLTAAELGHAARPGAANPHSIPSRWRAARKIFGVERRGQLLFARYQFDETFEPVPAVARVLRTLTESSPIGIASWFESRNAFLDGGRPKEWLGKDPELVVQAAEDSLVGPTHG